MKWYVTTSPSGSSDFFQVNVIVVGTPAWAFVGETRTGLAGGLLPVPGVVVDVPPVPLTVIVKGTVPATLLGMLKVSLDGPLTIGAKRTVSGQVAAGATVLPEQTSFRMLNGAASGSTLPIVPMTRSAVPVLVTVIVASAEAPTSTPPNGTCWSVAGAMVSVTEMSGTGMAVPVPLRANTTEGVRGSLLGIS